MKAIVITAMILAIASSSFAARYYGNTGYEREIRRACEAATSTRNRKAVYKNIPAAKRCFYDVVESNREQALVESQIDLNISLRKYFDDRRRHGRRW